MLIVFGCKNIEHYSFFLLPKKIPSFLSAFLLEAKLTKKECWRGFAIKTAKNKCGRRNHLFLIGLVEKIIVRESRDMDFLYFFVEKLF